MSHMRKFMLSSENAMGIFLPMPSYMNVVNGVSIRGSSAAQIRVADVALPS